MRGTNPNILGILNIRGVKNISNVETMEKLDTIRMNAALPRRIVTIRLIKMLHQKNWMMLLFVLWKVRQNCGCWIWEYHTMLLRVENYLRIMFQAIWGKCILVMTRRMMLLAKMKCRSN